MIDTLLKYHIHSHIAIQKILLVFPQSTHNLIEHYKKLYLYMFSYDFRVTESVFHALLWSSVSFPISRQLLPIAYTPIS